MNYNNPTPQQAAGITRYSCGFLFLAFSFCYLFFLMGEVMAGVQYVFSGGLTEYSIPVGAVIIPIVLMAVQWVVSKLLCLPNSAHILTYVPSFILLAMLSDLDRNVEGEFIWGMWRWLVPLILVCWIMLIGYVKLPKGEDAMLHITPQSWLWPNYLGMMLMICLTGFVSQAKDVEVYELKVERLLMDKDYEGAAGVALKSYASSPRLNQMRMYALARQGILADSLFSYPQYFGAKGLLDITDVDTVSRFKTRRIETFLGALPGNSIRNTERYLKVLCNDSVLANDNARQYLLCYLLLEKKVNDFETEFYKVYGDTIASDIPRAYQEALITRLPDLSPEFLPIYINKVYVERYNGYLAMKDSLTDATERKNLTRRQYGDSYWWYLDN